MQTFARSYFRNASFSGIESGPNDWILMLRKRKVIFCLTEKQVSGIVGAR